MMRNSNTPSPESRTSQTSNWSVSWRHLASDLSQMNGNVTLKRDRKAKDCWLITTTDKEGYHRQLPITFDDMRELVRLWIEETI